MSDEYHRYALPEPARVSIRRYSLAQWVVILFLATGPLLVRGQPLASRRKKEEPGELKEAGPKMHITPRIASLSKELKKRPWPLGRRGVRKTLECCG